MRLLKSKLISEPGALEIKDFDDNNLPKYAILSHRWGDDELTLQDVERGTTAKEGFKKVQQSCDMAKREGIDYIWIDTCCIDKTSSAELSEAINSMYLWYFKSHRCYAYLADVPSTPFGESQWFTRGWTLQELVAPADVVFFDATWNVLGTRESLQKEIFSCTGIPVGILSGDDDLETCSIAQRMSWAAKRTTKRVEDLAYCLLGIFRINMPLLYGEGERAFIRLQAEIMRVSNDHSLFAWESLDNRGGLLATSPAAFKGSGNIVPLSHIDDSHETFTVSSRGVHLDFPLIGKGAQRLGLALLRCKERDGSNNQIAIYLKDLTGAMETFRRVRSKELKRVDLTKIRSSQYMTRRGCIQVGRVIPTRSNVNDTELSEPHDDDEPEDFVNFAQPEALLHAAQEGRQDDIWLMLTRKDIDVNSWGRDGWPAIFHAVNNGHAAVVKMLLARGANINIEDFYGYTPLLLATEKGHEDMVELLLERGASMIMMNQNRDVWRDLDLIKDEEMLSFVFQDLREVHSEPHNNQRIPIFVWAAKKQQDNIIKLLLDKNTEVDLKKIYGPILLRWAARGGHTGIAEWLIDRGVAVNSTSRSYWGMTPGSIAALYGNEDTLNLLLEKGANIETTAEIGEKALFYAVAFGHINTIKLLLDKGTNIDGKDDDGRTPLSIAIPRGGSKAIELLVERGADIEAKDNDGRTPLSWAASDSDRLSIVTLLLEKGADIEARDNHGRTPLSWASTEFRNDDIIQLLLEKGADLEAKDNHGRTPLSWATFGYQNDDIVHLLLEKGADIEAKDNNGCTPLWWATAGKNHDGIVQLLLDKGAKAESEDKNDRTPGFQNGWRRDDIVQLLIDRGTKVEAKDENSTPSFCVVL
ncbi:HET protein [Trichoderma austrokoningii]